MKLSLQSPGKALNKAYLKEKVGRAEIEIFKASFLKMLARIDEGESEEHGKNIVADFLKNVWYQDAYEINTKDRKDLVIHTGKTAKDPVGVILEVKKPGNKAEMISGEKPNAKAMQELLLYYLRERIDGDNKFIRQLIITNIYEWFLIDEKFAEQYFFGNGQLRKDYEEFKQSGKPTSFFYEQIAKPFFDALDADIPCTNFDIRTYEKVVANANKADDHKLIALYKILSPVHLLKGKFANDSNSLDKGFYEELLHIIGLEEVKDGGKKLIQRKKKADEASLIENTITKLEDRESLRNLNNASSFGATKNEQINGVALELCITWVNRVLFMKLLEAQLLKYHKGNKDFLFLNTRLVHDYDELSNLFFGVLAERPTSRKERLAGKFKAVPYLNSSLFERTELERTAIDTSNLDNQLQLPLAAHTVLKDDKGKTLAGSLSTLDYLFRFLDAYDFTSEGAEEIQEENKNLINASVLGLIFEKINGYKDGSFFTPGFVTMYMCRETIRRAVVQKFNEALRKKNNDAADAPDRYTTLDEVYNAIPRDIDRDGANKLINSLTICDPAVGSGHFLVSALNEIIAIKSELRILQDAEGKLLRDVDVVVENDELIVTEEGRLFQYNPQGKESRRVQETLFHEKQRLIEGCLFGVDINPNSVKICRLRLWIELLKNAYYTADSGYTELETLPNIDINIKTGNSLVSRFALDADLAPALKSLKWDINAYRGFVQDYKEAKGKEEKRGLEALIEGIKKDFRTEIGRNDPKLKKLSKLNGEYEALMNQREIFELSKAESKQRKTQREKLEKDIDKLSTEVQDIKNNKIYEQAFEWRFEFPEVLDNEARFMGFDVVIGNPPYIRQEELGDAKKYLKEAYKNVFAGTADLLVYFFELGIGLLKNSGHFTMITSNKFMRANYGKSLRHYLRSHNLERIIDFGELPVFENAATFPAIFSLTKKPPTNAVSFAQVKSLDFESLETLLTTIAEPLPESAVSGDNWTLANESGSFLIEKMKVGTVSLGEYVGNKINYGVKTGFNPAFVIDAKKRDELINQDANAAEIIFPFRVGDDVRKYEIREADRFIIFTQRGIDIEKYPSVRNHLSAFREKLEPDGVSGRKQGPYAWYEIQDTVAYYESFNLPKIIYPVIGKESRFAFDRDTLFLNDKTFFIPIEDYFLLGYLNSKLAWYYLKAICSVLGDADKGGRLELRAVHVKTLPIPNASEASKTKIANIVTQVLNAKQNGEDTTVLEAEIDELVYELYQLSAEERGIVGGKQA